MFRNEPGAARAAFVFVILAILLGFLSRIGTGRVQTIMLVVGILFFGLGFFISIDSEVQIMGSSDRPRLSASWKVSDRLPLELTGSAKASGVKADEQLQVAVLGAEPGASKGERIYYSKTGPDADGVAEQPFQVFVDTERYERVLVTANLGDQPATCEGEPLNPETFDIDKQKPAIKNACLDLLTLPDVTPTTSPPK